MKGSLRFFLRPTLLLGALFAAHGIQDARAAGVLVCDNCRDPRALALASGTGPTIVADFQQRRIHGFEVEYDRELRRYRALPTEIPQPIRASFNRIMGMLDMRGQTVELSPRQLKGRGVEFNVHPDNPQSANGITFPEAHKNLNAYDVVQLATERSQLEQDIGKAFAGATTSSAAWNSMATFLSSIGLSFISKALGIDNAIYNITWRDGSKTTLVIAPGSADRAHYVKGRSLDAKGNLIPDRAATDPELVESYVGDYYFDNRDDLDRWMYSAYLYGVTVRPGGPQDALQVTCLWDGRNLVCRLVR